MGKTKVEAIADIERARSWFHETYGEEFSLTDLASYFEHRYQDAVQESLRNRFESLRGPDLALYRDVCVDMVKTVARPPKRR